MDAAGADQLAKLTPQQKDELMKTVQTQVALANMQELLTVSKFIVHLSENRVIWFNDDAFYYDTEHLLHFRK